MIKKLLFGLLLLSSSLVVAGMGRRGPVAPPEGNNSGYSAILPEDIQRLEAKLLGMGEGVQLTADLRNDGQRRRLRRMGPNTSEDQNDPFTAILPEDKSRLENQQAYVEKIIDGLASGGFLLKKEDGFLLSLDNENILEEQMIKLPEFMNKSIQKYIDAKDGLPKAAAKVEVLQAVEAGISRILAVPEKLTGLLKGAKDELAELKKEKSIADFLKTQRLNNSVATGKQKPSILVQNILNNRSRISQLVSDFRRAQRAAAAEQPPMQRRLPQSQPRTSGSSGDKPQGPVSPRRPSLPRPGSPMRTIGR